MILTAWSLTGAASAHANPLLSGYGGPGEGSQAIIGASYANGSSGKGGGSGSGGPSQAATGSGGGSSAPSGAASRAAAGGSGRSSGPGAGARQGSGAGATGASPRAAGGAGASGSSPGSNRATTVVAVSHTSSGAASALSGNELLYVLLVLGALGATAVLTRQLTRGRP